MKAEIYTRGGDAGQTSLLGGVRTDKDDPRVEVYGTLDEGTSALGLARATTHYDDLCRLVINLQGELISIMSEVANPPGIQPRKAALPRVRPEQVKRLEDLIDHYNDEWIQTGQFVRPGGSQASAAFDLARAVFRRAERRLITLGRREAVNPELLKYLNRLSDLLYVLARIDEQRTIIAAMQKVMGQSQEPGDTDAGEAALTARNGEGTVMLSLTDSDRMINAGMRRASELGVPMVLAVVDQNGDVIETRRMDNARIISVALAPNKAYTAATVRVPTHELARLAQPGQPFYHLDANLPRVSLVGGGLPLTKDGQIVGAVGASGGSIEQDIDVAQAMVAAY